MKETNFYTSTVTVKGQVTIPAELRRKLAIKPAGKVVFFQEGDSVHIKPLASIEDLAGCLHKRGIRPITDSEIRRIREKGEIFKDKR